MKYCTVCGRYMYDRNIVAVVSERNIITGVSLTCYDVCVYCHELIIQKNMLYNKLVSYFTKHPFLLSYLRTLHELKEPEKEDTHDITS